MSDLRVTIEENVTQIVRIPEANNLLVTVYEGIQGPAGDSGSGGGGAIVDTGSYSSPVSITTSITIPTDGRARKFVQGSGAVIDPTLGSGTTTQEIFLFGVSNTNTIELNSTTNLLLSGKIILKLGTMLSLQWVPGLLKWVEVTRNEI